MTTLTVLTLLVILYGVLNRGGYARALALGGATPMGAALVVGSVAVPTFYAVAIGAAVAVGLTVLGGGPFMPASRQRLPPGVPLLLLFLAWALMVTLLAPFLFDGVSVQLPTSQNATLHAGVLTSSNIAQTGYLVLGICVVVYVARSRSCGPELVGLATGAVILLSLWRYGHVEFGLPFPEGVFDNSPFYKYIETAPGGEQRFRGILSEPSALAGAALVTISYMIPRAVRVTGLRRWGAVVMAAAAAYLGVISTSTTFVVAGVVVAAVAALTFLFGFLRRRTSVTTLVSLLSVGLVIVALWLVPIVAGFVESAVDEKVGSASYDERSAADTASYQTFLDTFGVGTGLGSNRASSFVAGLLSTTGIVGSVLLAAAVVELIRRNAADRAYRPVIWALVASLTLKVIAGPDLSDTSGVFWLALGLLSQGVLRGREGQQEGVASGAVTAMPGQNGAGGRGAGPVPHSGPRLHARWGTGGQGDSP